MGSASRWPACSRGLTHFLDSMGTANAMLLGLLLGGPLVTGGGVAFLSGTLDYYLRAYDLRTGTELWTGRLPAGGQATPMSCTSAKSGRQYVVVMAGAYPLAVGTASLLSELLYARLKRGTAPATGCRAGMGSASESPRPMAKYLKPLRAMRSGA